MALSDAQQEQVDALRSLLGDWDGDDQSVHDLLTGAGGDLNRAAAAGWRAKSAAYAGLVDVQEGSSKRPLSQLSGVAWGMALRFDALAAEGAGSPSDGRAFTRPIVRR